MVERFDLAGAHVHLTREDCDDPRFVLNRMLGFCTRWPVDRLAAPERRPELLPRDLDLLPEDDAEAPRCRRADSAEG